MRHTYTIEERKAFENIIEKQVLTQPVRTFQWDGKISDDEDEGPESTLSKRIRQHCKDKAYPALVFPQTQDVRNFLPPGWPDGTILVPDREIIFLEIKRPKGGRKSPAQKEMAIRFLHLGHKIHEVKTWKKYIEIVYRKT